MKCTQRMSVNFKLEAHMSLYHLSDKQDLTAFLSMSNCDPDDFNIIYYSLLQTVTGTQLNFHSSMSLHVKYNCISILSF